MFTLDPTQMVPAFLELLRVPEVRAELRAITAAEPAPVHRTHETMDQFGERWDVCRKTVKKWTGLGMPFVRLGKEIRIPVAPASSWLDAGNLNISPIVRARRQASPRRAANE